MEDESNVFEGVGRCILMELGLYVCGGVCGGTAAGNDPELASAFMT